MEGVPAVCTACRTPMVDGEARCRQCGKIYGDDNLCPSCHNTTAVRADGALYRCLACGAPRERKPGTVVATPDILPIAPAIEAATGPLVLRGLGAMSAGGAVLTAALALFLIGGAAGIALAIAIGALGLGTAALLFRVAKRRGAVAALGRRAERERQLMELARERGGALTITDAQRKLGLTAAGAEALLDSFTDGSRVTMEITSDGRVEYHFREVRALEAPQVRVAVDEAEPVEVPAAEDTSDASRRNPRS